MHAPTLRFALPAIVILAVVTIAIIALVLLTHAHVLGTAYGMPQ